MAATGLIRNTASKSDYMYQGVYNPNTNKRLLNK